ncbi:hypothetical protein ACFRAR_02835 [Kitasatospora sp. NPDC056651]|uniref:hypothetical protein n=1 Tax=Streptomycetaceae TaxID=2062 RepID=UPI001CCD88C1|nr:hypothetical protein [Streptomyces sp. LS1784]
MSTEPESPSPSRTLRSLWVAVAALFSLVVALVGGILSFAQGTAIPGVVLYGGGIFGGCMALALVVLGKLGILE